MKSTAVIWIATSLSSVVISSPLISKPTHNGEPTSGIPGAYASNLLAESMDWMDRYYDVEAGYLYNLDAMALTHDTRSSVWYSAGLLARNRGDDVVQAERIVRNVVGGQFGEESKQWYATYQKYPEEPSVGTASYPATMYNTWDPNWRGFIGTTFILMLEEHATLISPSLQSLMLQSLYNTSVGDSYRVGGLDGDNLYPAYSNPSLMRAFTTGWTGRRLGDANMTAAGEMYAAEVIELFERDGTLSEFNSGTYAGISLYALTLWRKYMPGDSVMRDAGGFMVTETWGKLGLLYNANLRNVAGPWDRSYGFDMNRYLSILALQIWSIVGKEKAPINGKPYAMGHKSDFAFAPLVAILAPFHNTLIDDTTLSSLHTFPGTHTVKTSAFSPPFDTYPRNITAWLSENLTIGAESFSENVIGGPAKNPSSFNPAVVQWGRKDGSVGFLNLYSQVFELEVGVGEKKLGLRYPAGNSTSSFQFVVGTNGRGGKRDVERWEDVEGIKVNVSGSVDAEYQVSFNGMMGGAGKTINDFEFWNFTYTMPLGSTETPYVLLEFELE